MKIENRKGMVRVVVAIASKYSSCLSTDREECEKRGNAYAVGLWHRHDEEDLENKLNKEAEIITNAYHYMYSKTIFYSGLMYGIEWKDYEN